MLAKVAVVVLVANALFWGLAGHHTHCKFAKAFLPLNTPCPSHWVHLSMGLVFYLASVAMAQREFLFKQH